MTTNAHPFHVADRTRYGGGWDECIPVDSPDVPAAHGLDFRWPTGQPFDGSYVILKRHAQEGVRGAVLWHAWAVDVFPTEAEARAACKARRKQRQPRQPRPLHGDYAQLAAFVGIATDGSGRRTR